MVETALVLPLCLGLLFLTIDLARAVYTYSLISQEAQLAARSIALPDNIASDCAAISAVSTAGNGMTISADSRSVLNDGNPTGDPAPSPAPWTTPTQPNTGLLYLYPAQATASPITASNCANSAGSRQGAGSVTAQVTFDFVPWTPIASQLVPSIVLRAQATVVTQY